MDINLFALVVSAAAIVLIAFAGYLIAHRDDVRRSQRQVRLNRIGRQLRDLYGPLFSLTHTEARVFAEFVRRYGAHDSMSVFGGRPTEEQFQVWRLWMTTVFMPQNRRVYDLVVSNADLLIEEEIPKCLLDLCAHVAACEAVIKRWEGHDYAEWDSAISYPANTLLEYSSTSFRELKRQQGRLLAEKGFKA